MAVKGRCGERWNQRRGENHACLLWMVRRGWVVWMVGLVDPPFLPSPRLPTTTEFTPLAGSICPTEPTESLGERWRFTPPPPPVVSHPLSRRSELHRRRRVLRRCRTGGDTTSCCCSLLSNKPRIRSYPRSIGFLSSSSSSRPKVEDCISVGVHIERRVNTYLFHGPGDRYPGSRQSNLKGYHRALGRIARG